MNILPKPPTREDPSFQSFFDFVYEVAGLNPDSLVNHQQDPMPHRFTEGGKNYKWGLKVVAGVVEIHYEEVL